MKKIFGALGEALTEIIASIILLGVGYGIFLLLGGEVSVFDIDPDLLILIGLTATALLGLVTYLAVRTVRMVKNRRAAAGEKPHGKDDSPSSYDEQLDYFENNNERERSEGSDT